MAINSVIHTNQHSIDRVLHAGLPVVLAFWSGEAGLEPRVETKLEELATRYAGRALIAKIDAGTEAELLSRFDIGRTPALALVKNGAVVTRASGAADPDHLARWLAYLVEGGAEPSPFPTPQTPPRQQARPDSARPAGQTTGQTANQNRPLKLTEADFQQVINSTQPVLVDFWAEWCGPCHMIAPTVEQLAQEFSGQAVVAKLNVDENPNIAHRYNIMGIPAMLIFKNGTEVDRIVGVQPIQALRQKLTQHVT